MTTEASEGKLKTVGYRWIILIINWLTVFFIYSAWLFILVTLKDITPNETERTWIWTLPFIGLACMAVPSGLIIDKYGLKKTGYIGLSIVLAGAFLRGFFFNNFIGLALSSILLGFGVGMITPIGNKLISLWFGENEVGTASGITIMAAGLGIAVSQSISGLFLKPLLGSWQAVFFFYAGCLVIVLILWNFIREKPRDYLKDIRVPLRESLSKAMRNKFVWMLAGAYFVILAVYFTVLKVLYPIFLDKLKDPNLGNMAISLVSYAAMSANVIMPIVSDRLRNRKYLILIAFIILAPFLILVYFVENLWIWILGFIIGFMVGTIIPILVAIPIELRGVGHSYVSGATGLMAAMGNLGGLTIPMVYLLIAESSMEIIGFIFLVILIIGAILLVIPIPETAGKSQEVNSEGD